MLQSPIEIYKSFLLAFVLKVLFNINFRIKIKTFAKHYTYLNNNKKKKFDQKSSGNENVF
jgi:hypothetical protein